MRLAPFFAPGILVASSVAAFAYTPQDAKACMNDAFRLCPKAIPNPGRVASCLNAKKAMLSAACADAFARYMRVDAPRHHTPQVYRD